MIMHDDIYDVDEVQLIIQDIENHYGEWLEMAGDDSPALRERIIIQMLLREMSEKNFYERELRKVLHRTRDESVARYSKNQNYCNRCRYHYGREPLEK